MTSFPHGKLKLDRPLCGACFAFLHKLAQRYNERSEETSIHTEILEELSLWLEYGTLLYVRLGAADLAMWKSNFVLVSMDDVMSVTSRTVALYF